MKEAVTKVIDTLTQEAFQQLLERYNKCIADGGDYFEGDLCFMCVLSIKVPIRKSLETMHLVVGSYIGPYTYASVIRRVVTLNIDNKYRALVEKMIQLDANWLASFRSSWKKNSRSNFTKHKQRQVKSQIKRNHMS